jgi:hypothetical protein
MHNWYSGSTVEEDEIADLRQFAISKDFLGPVTKESAKMAADIILHYEVIGRRKLQLEMLRKGFSETPLLRYLRSIPT